VAQAAAEAMRPPRRPVYVEVPTDLLGAEVGADGAEPAPAPEWVAPQPDEHHLAQAVELLDHARRPLIWAGGGALQADAGAAVARLAERLVAPVILTYSAHGLLPPGHPCLVDASPHVPDVGALWDEADVVVAIGSDLDGMMTLGWKQPQPPHLIALNIDPADAAKNYLPDLLLEADAATGAAALAERAAERGGLDALAKRVKDINASVRDALTETDGEALGFVEAVERALPDDAVVVCDMCIPGYWLGGFHRTPAPRKLAYPLGWGTLGCGFPQGLGAALAGAGPAVSVSGDGGFLYACGELATAAQERIPLTAVVVDDGGYGMLRFDQELKGDPHEGVDLQTPDFAALARSFGVRADEVEGLGERFEGMLGHHLRLDEPTVLVARAALQPPPNVSPRWYRR
jgi:acetolactate synthase-1/2/3 large subunit